MQNLGNKRSVQKYAQIVGSNVLKKHFNGKKLNRVSINLEERSNCVENDKTRGVGGCVLKQFSTKHFRF